MVKKLIFASCLMLGQCVMPQQIQQCGIKTEADEMSEIKGDFPIHLGAYYYDIEKWPLSVGKARVVFDKYDDQGYFSNKELSNIVSSIKQENTDKKMYYLSFYFSAGIGSLKAEKNFETLAVKINNEIKPILAIYDEGKEKMLFDRINKKIYCNEKEISISQEDFEDICDPMTLLVKMMTTPANKEQKEIQLCKFNASKIEKIVLKLSKEGEIFAGETKLPEGLFEFSEKVAMKIYYFPSTSKDGILMPTMKYKLCTKAPWLGSFATEFRYCEEY